MNDFIAIQNWNSKKMELASNLADDSLNKYLCINTMISKFKDEDAKVLEYTEEAQKLFDKEYDFFISEIEDILTS